jgi:hypothetical protein
VQYRGMDCRAALGADRIEDPEQSDVSVNSSATSVEVPLVTAGA